MNKDTSVCDAVAFNDTIDGNQSAQKIKQILGVKQPSKKLTRASAPIKLTIE